MKKVIILFLISSMLVMSYDTNTNSMSDNNTYDTESEYIPEEVILDNIELNDNPDLDIRIDFSAREDGKQKFDPVVKKFKIGKSLYYMIRITAIISEDYDNRYINATVKIPNIDRYSISFSEGRLLKQSGNSYEIQIRTSYSFNMYENRFIFKINAKEECYIPINIEFQEPYSENNIKNTVEFRKKILWLF